MSDKEARLFLDKGTVLVYIAGERPYYWLGTADGTYIDSVDAADLKAFVKAPTKHAAAARLEGDTE